MNKKEFDVLFGFWGEEQYEVDNKDIDELWQWIEQYGKKQRANELEELKRIYGWQLGKSHNSILMSYVKNRIKELNE